MQITQRLHAHTLQPACIINPKQCFKAGALKGSNRQFNRTASAVEASPKSCNRRALLASASVLHFSRSRSAVAVMAAAGSKDLLIVGPGVLGSVTGKLWKEEFPEATVVAQTNTTNNHER